METLVTVLIIEIQQDERAAPSGTGASAPPLPASGSLCPSTCPPALLLLGVHHWHPLEDTKGSVAHSHPALLPSPDLLDGRHHLLDVILGPAPGLGPHGPAGHAGGAGAQAEPAAGPPPVRRAQARRQAGAPFKLLANRNRNLYNHSSKRGFSESGGEWQPGLPHHSGNLETQLRKGRWLQLWLSTSLEQINKLFPSNLVRFLLWWPSKGSNAA